MTTETPLAYSIIEAAKAIGISRTSIYVEIAKGRLRVRKVGRRSLISDADLKAWLAALPNKTST
ncbi:excisionase family DNA binding protein [Bradyrhizobium sp. JR4.1]|uniref:excisionase family DNA-binding protein n=1 Tax=Bradyrhizobium sp. JR4.1 TaxID=3156372 RepID=UPI00339863E8